MLTLDEEKYLSKIPADKKVKFLPYDPETLEIANKLIFKIKSVLTDADVRFMGASALGISGQSDIDIYILASPDKHSRYLPKLKKMFGEPLEGISLIEWSFVARKHEISIYLDDPDKPSTQNQIKTFNLLKNDKKLLSEYEKIKDTASKLSLRKYQRVKYEFYHKILGE